MAGARFTLCHPPTQGSGVISRHGPTHRTGTDPLRPGPPRRRTAARRPGAWLRDQLRQPDPSRIDPRPSTATGLAALLRRPRQTKPKPEDSRVRALFRAEAKAELDNALTTPAPFRERLVWFWTNHFTVSVRGGIAAVRGAFVEEAIRPHVTGRFEDMLLAVMHHPAMLLYLNNAGSVGPDSPAGQRSHRGLNENLARECLELHTVSPAAGYTQADVTNFAKILTGWSIDLRDAIRPASASARSPTSRARRSSWARRFPPGEEGGVAALHFLANHPATHRFLATKLVRHFVADEPPPDAVRRIEGVLRDTGGNLGAAAAALITLDAAWQPGRQAAHAAGLRDRQPARAGPAAGAARDASTCRASWPASASRSGTRRSRMAGPTAPATGPRPRR